MTNVFLDSPKLLTDGKSLSFNVLLQDDEGNEQLIAGFRSAKGKLHPPSMRFGAKFPTYVRATYFSPGLIKKIFNAYQAAEWPEKASVELLFEPEISCSDLWLTNDVRAQYFPLGLNRVADGMTV